MLILIQNNAFIRENFNSIAIQVKTSYIQVIIFIYRGSKQVLLFKSFWEAVVPRLKTFLKLHL